MKLMARWIVVAAIACGLSASYAEAATESKGEEHIRQLDIAWEKAVQTKDLESVLAFYRDDCVGLFTSLPISVGKDNMRGVWQRILSRSQLNLHWTPTHIEVARSGDLAYDYGSMHLTYVDDKGGNVTFVGKYTVVWKKDGKDEWKVAVDMSNPDTKENVQYNQ